MTAITAAFAVSIGVLAGCAGTPRETPVYVVAALDQRQAQVVVSDPGELERAFSAVDPEVVVLEAHASVLADRDPWNRQLPRTRVHRGVSSPLLRPEGPAVYAARVAGLPAMVERAATEHPGRRILVVVQVDHRAQVSRRLRATASLQLMELQRVSSAP
jgi:hypothetical protein